MSLSTSGKPGELITEAYLPDSAAPDQSPEARARLATLIDQRRLSAQLDTLRRNVEYASTFPPASQNTGCLGRLDYVEEVSSQGLVVRGWLFHREHPIERLFLSTEATTTRAYCIGLERTDVSEIFYLFKTSLRSGFMAVFPGTFSNAPDSLSFQAKLRDKTVRSGKITLVGG